MKKLLITMGCSFTEGCGCYEPELLKEFEGRDLYKLTLQEIGYLQVRSRNRNHTHGWPSNLQRLLNYDKLINLGYGGASNSQAVKTWFENLYDVNFDDYEVLVIWMMTFSNRIGFYRNGYIKSILPMLKGHSKEEQVRIDNESDFLYESYINFLGDSYDLDTNLEAVFYLKIIKKICELSNYKFLHINVDQHDGNMIDTLMENTDSSMNKHFVELYPYVPTIIGDRELLQYRSPVCGHPNEEGYELIAQRMFNIIKVKHPDLISQNKVEKYEMKYLGEPNYKHKIIL